MTEVQYFECENCGQVVQGWGASRDIDCCEKQRFIEIEGPEMEMELLHLVRDVLPNFGQRTKSGNYRK